MKCYAETSDAERARTIELTRAELLHMTRRTRLDDGRWQTVCDCGWASESADHPDALGWACRRADAIRAQQRAEERAA